MIDGRSDRSVDRSPRAAARRQGGAEAKVAAIVVGRVMQYVSSRWSSRRDAVRGSARRPRRSATARSKFFPSSSVPLVASGRDSSSHSARGARARRSHGVRRVLRELELGPLRVVRARGHAMDREHVREDALDEERRARRDDEGARRDATFRAASVPPRANPSSSSYFCSSSSFARRR